MKKIINKCLVLMVVVVATSCLDEDPLFDPTKSNNIIEFFDIGAIASPAGAIHPVYVKSLSPGQTLSVILSYSGANNNDQDISVTMEINQKALDDYNDEQGTSFELLPASLYSLDGLTVTIPKGQTKVTLEISPDINNFDFSKSYALPLKIVSASSGIISGNFGTAIFSIGPKNRWDGVYTVTGTMKDLVNGAFVGSYPKTIELRTIDANTVVYYDNAFALSGHVFNTGTGLSFYGGFVATFDFDASDNVTEVRNGFGQGNNNRAGKLDPTGTNKFVFEADGVTPKTLDISYIMQQLNTIGDRTFWKETYTYLGPR